MRPRLFAFCLDPKGFPKPFGSFCLNPLFIGSRSPTRISGFDFIAGLRLATGGSVW